MASPISSSGTVQSFLGLHTARGWPERNSVERKDEWIDRWTAGDTDEGQLMSQGTQQSLNLSGAWWEDHGASVLWNTGGI